MKPGKEALEALLALPDDEAAGIVAALDADLVERFAEDWPAWVHTGQSVPDEGPSPGSGGSEWRVCVILGGRGFGKTRAGAEWISELARERPAARFALVAATLNEARQVMIEGPSGLIAVARSDEVERMRWEPSRRRLVFASGAEARLYSGASADSLRGPEHDFAWCDELAKWKQASAAWANLLLGLRRGEAPRALVTTTPRAGPLLKALILDGATVNQGGPSEANAQLAPLFLADMRRRLGGTRAGREELDGELIDEAEGALWSRALIESCRRGAQAAARDRLGRVVVGVDPPAIEGVCGIVVCGIDQDGLGLVLADLSAGGLTPEGWALKVAGAAEAWGAERVIAEANNGGRMVASVLIGAGLKLPVKLVHASEGKAARAAPVATLFESGRAGFAGRFAALEDELCGLCWGGAYAGPGRSPDRADAMVWAMTELLLGPQGEPRVRTL